MGRGIGWVASLLGEFSLLVSPPSPGPLSLRLTGLVPESLRLPLNPPWCIPMYRRYLKRAPHLYKRFPFLSPPGPSPPLAPLTVFKFLFVYSFFFLATHSSPLANVVVFLDPREGDKWKIGRPDWCSLCFVPRSRTVALSYSQCSVINFADAIVLQPTPIS